MNKLKTGGNIRILPKIISYNVKQSNAILIWLTDKIAAKEKASMPL